MSAIGDVIDQIIATVVTKLVDIARELTARGIARPDGKRWTTPAVARIHMAHRLDRARAQRSTEAQPAAVHKCRLRK